MKKLNYKNLTKIIVKSQEELDAIPSDFKGRIYIQFGTSLNPAIVKTKYSLYVIAYDNSSVRAYDNSSVRACDNSSVIACDNSSVIACDNSSVRACDNSSVRAYDNSSVRACDNSSVEACGNSSVEACGNSSVEACDNSSVRAYDNSSVRACGNVQIVDYLQGAKVKISGNARIVYMPKTIHEFMDFYGIKHTKTQATFYKAVRKVDGKYLADYNPNFEYKVGETKKEECDSNTERDCSNGIHIAHLDWALRYGNSNIRDFAILEVKTKISDIVLPNNSTGKVRTSRVKVVREVPLEECGVLGKIVAKRRAQNAK